MSLTVFLHSGPTVHPRSVMHVAFGRKALEAPVINKIMMQNICELSNNDYIAAQNINASEVQKNKPFQNNRTLFYVSERYRTQLPKSRFAPVRERGPGTRFAISTVSGTEGGRFISERPGTVYHVVWYNVPHLKKHRVPIDLLIYKNI